MLTKEEYKFILDRVIENVVDAAKEEKRNDDFSRGRALAYYEILDTIKNELEVRDENLASYGVPKALEKFIYG